MARPNSSPRELGDRALGMLAVPATTRTAGVLAERRVPALSLLNSSAEGSGGSAGLIKIGT
jgi:hypothetical protein